MKLKLKFTFISIAIVLLSLNLSTFAQDDKSATHASLAAASQNPIASLISLPFQFNFNLGMGSYDRMQTVINIEPVLPVKIGKNWNMINRIIIPVMVQPDLSSESGSTTGLGSINYTAFFSPKPLGKVSIGFGPSMVFPTNTSSELGNGQFAVGPSAVLFAGLGKWTLGFVAAQNWAYYNQTTSSTLSSSFFVQYFVNYNIKNGWSIGTAPTITANWMADEGEKAIVPFGLNFAKVAHLGSQATKFSLAYYYNAVRPTAGPKGGQIQFTVVLLFPEK